eukprot:3011879-Prymnesium_polylepis.2
MAHSHAQHPSSLSHCQNAPNDAERTTLGPPPNLKEPLNTKIEQLALGGFDRASSVPSLLG